MGRLFGELLFWGEGEHRRLELGSRGRGLPRYLDSICAVYLELSFFFACQVLVSSVASSSPQAPPEGRRRHVGFVMRRSRGVATKVSNQSADNSEALENMVTTSISVSMLYAQGGPDILRGMYISCTDHTFLDPNLVHHNLEFQHRTATSHDKHHAT